MRHDKLDTALLNALEDFDEEGENALAAHSRSLGVRAAFGNQGPASAEVFLDCDPDADLDDLRLVGIRVTPPTGRFRTATVPLVKLADLSEHRSVRRIIGSQHMRPRMDIACNRVQIPPFVSRTQLKGSGVIVAVIDTGIDASHPSFANRILKLWDQTLPGPGVAEGAYGTELSGMALGTSHDTHGHGTHVAGIAAGNHGVYNGVAPQADLIIVKTDFQDAHIAAGVRYAFRCAGELQRPCVVNLSLGGHSDGHDGTDPLSLIIDSESGPGRIVCCAAGNEGNDNIHGQAIVAPGASKRMRFRVPPSIIGMAKLNGWYRGPATLEVALQSPGGFRTPYQAVIVGQSFSKPYTLPDARVRNATPGPDPISGDFHFEIQIRGTGLGTAVKSGIWQLLVRNIANDPVQLDVWTLDDQDAPQVTFSGTSVRDSIKIGSPGAAEEAITIGAYTTRTQWTDVGGQAQEVGLAMDDVSDFSSEGPTRDGREKPDLVAPGAMIASALSRHSNAAQTDMPAPAYVVMGGTSMATPFVCGLVALLLERNPALDSMQVKTMLRQNATWPGQVAGTFHPKHGAGLISAAAL